MEASNIGLADYHPIGSAPLGNFMALLSLKNGHALLFPLSSDNAFLPHGDTSNVLVPHPDEKQ